MKATTGSQRGKDADFWRIRARLPRETREYVPLMVAAALIGKEPGKYGLEGVKRWLPLEMEEVEVPAATKLATVAEAVGVGEAELKRMNPHLVRAMTPPGGKPYGVRIPRGRGDQYAANFATVQRVALARAEVERKEEQRKVAERREEQRKVAARRQQEQRRVASGRRHTVRNGESLWTIARRYDTTVKRLQAANSIRPGQKLRIPA
jgi:membrane-bound lytic murein transglycosylase D